MTPQLIQLKDGDWIDPRYVSTIKVFPYSTTKSYQEGKPDYVHKDRVVICSGGLCDELRRETSRESHHVIEFDNLEQAKTYQLWLGQQVNDARRLTEKFDVDTLIDRLMDVAQKTLRIQQSRQCNDGSLGGGPPPIPDGADAPVVVGDAETLYARSGEQ